MAPLLNYSRTDTQAGADKRNKGQQYMINTETNERTSLLDVFTITLTAGGIDIFLLYVINCITGRET